MFLLATFLLLERFASHSSQFGAGAETIQYHDESGSLARAGAVGPLARATSPMPANPGLMHDTRQGPIRLYDRGNGIGTMVYEGMANGQLILVTTEPLEGGSPVRSVYHVAEQDPAKAIVGAMMAPNETVEAWGPLPEVAVKALGLKPGDFTHG